MIAFNDIDYDGSKDIFKLDSKPTYAYSFEAEGQVSSRQFGVKSNAFRAMMEYAHICAQNDFYPLLRMVEFPHRFPDAS